MRPTDLTGARPATTAPEGVDIRPSRHQNDAPLGDRPIFHDPGPDPGSCAIYSLGTAASSRGCCRHGTEGMETRRTSHAARRCSAGRPWPRRQPCWGVFPVPPQPSRRTLRPGSPPAAGERFGGIQPASRQVDETLSQTGRIPQTDDGPTKTSPATWSSFATAQSTRSRPVRVMA